mgnify:CR=1 FL=1
MFSLFFRLLLLLHGSLNTTEFCSEDVFKTVVSECALMKQRNWKSQFVSGSLKVLFLCKQVQTETVTVCEIVIELT